MTLVGDNTLTGLRKELSEMQGLKPGFTLNFQYKDRGPIPGHLLSAPVGIASDILGGLSGGAIGTPNQVDAFLGTYSGRVAVVSVGMRIRAQFHVWNYTDIHSSTHLYSLPEPSQPVIFGRFEETFDWTQQW